MLHFYTSWKCQKTKGFLFSGCIEMEYWAKMKVKVYFTKYQMNFSDDSFTSSKEKLLLKIRDLL